MPINPQRALEGYLRALAYDSDDFGPAPGPGRPATTAGAGSEPAPAPAAAAARETASVPETARPKASVPGTAQTKAPVPAPEQAPPATHPAGLLLRLLSLRRGPAAAERARRA
ncbi:hypothetical protein CP973_24270 [Streptomyces albofaciens JCM 4342]|uniref:hypothetical protein n=1 Tax=Streptomyces albofaciens TaxID=66866 RepID=UPI001238F33F|nr:hypothetical protein [Streptomyces albofaciens]KAA6212507.1 hypothetical protein CP973_24270 [Streptomyces albofaciens JCM 4342]